MIVHVNSPQGGLTSPSAFSLPALSHHPKFGVGHKMRLLYLPITTTIDDVIKMVTGMNYSTVYLILLFTLSGIS